MPHELWSMMLAEAAFIIASEKHADLLSPTINDLRAKGDVAGARALVLIAGQHRVGALEARGRLIGLAVQWRREANGSR